MKHRNGSKGSASHGGKKSAGKSGVLNDLREAIFNDTLPRDSCTNDIWGFYRASSSPEGLLGAIYLLSIYQRLVKDHGIDPQTLDRWRQQGVLLNEAKRVFGSIPSEDRGDSYLWLLRNEYVLDSSHPAPSVDGEDVTHRCARSGWNFATNGRPATDATIQSTMSSWPTRKYECAMLCGLLLEGFYPPPQLALWLQFGFCVGDQHSEVMIAEMYKKLLNSTSFDEFQHAYENSQLVGLLARKGLTHNVAFSRVAGEFQDVVEGSARGLLKSAWSLKGFIKVNQRPIAPGEGIAVGLAVLLDYGWVNCKDNHDVNRLLRVYQDYFNSPGASCLELHTACINGRLVEFLEKSTKVRLSKQCKRLLKNFYPLPPPRGGFDARAHSGLMFHNLVAEPVPTYGRHMVLFVVVAAILVMYIARS